MPRKKQKLPQDVLDQIDFFVDQHYNDEARDFLGMIPPEDRTPNQIAFLATPPDDIEAFRKFIAKFSVETSDSDDAAEGDDGLTLKAPARSRRAKKQAPAARKQAPAAKKKAPAAKKKAPVKTANRKPAKKATKKAAPRAKASKPPKKK